MVSHEWLRQHLMLSSPSQAEMSIENKERGPEVAFQCIFLVGGCAFAYWVDFGFTRMTNQVSWVCFASL
jgi:hypothetical protein